MKFTKFSYQNISIFLKNVDNGLLWLFIASSVSVIFHFIEIRWRHVITTLRAAPRIYRESALFPVLKMSGTGGGRHSPVNSIQRPAILRYVQHVSIFHSPPFPP